MYYTNSEGLRLYYEIQGNPESELSLVFLNGLSQSTLAWSAVAPAFYAEYTVVLVDLIFQGQSDKAEEYRSYDQHAADVAALLQSVQISKPVLCGISYGSAVAQHVLVNHAELVSGAVLISTFAHDTALFKAMGESWKSALKQGGYSLMLDVMLPSVLGKSYFEKPLIPIETLKELRVSRQLETSDLLNLMRATEERGDYRERLKSIEVPVLVMQGEEDLLIPPAIGKEVADYISGARFMVIEKVGHTLNLEAIPQLIGEIRNFVGNLKVK
jgi:3-oxoadipate enol-lactonase